MNAEVLGLCNALDAAPAGGAATILAVLADIMEDLGLPRKWGCNGLEERWIAYRPYDLSDGRCGWHRGSNECDSYLPDRMFCCLRGGKSDAFYFADKVGTYRLYESRTEAYLALVQALTLG